MEEVLSRPTFELEREIDTLCSALEAALRWPYANDMKEHIANPSGIPKNYDDCYISDIYDMRAGMRIVQKRQKAQPHSQSSSQTSQNGV